MPGGDFCLAQLASVLCETLIRKKGLRSECRGQGQGCSGRQGPRLMPTGLGVLESHSSKNPLCAKLASQDS